MNSEASADRFHSAAGYPDERTRGALFTRGSTAQAGIPNTARRFAAGASRLASAGFLRVQFIEPVHRRWHRIIQVTRKEWCHLPGNP